ncbi:MAG: hypothetical protein HPM95_10775 [Alphaproteobacteria bacterium]|nr:hypothetical protein [Alphaproteobacteria bacterium]
MAPAVVIVPPAGRGNGDAAAALRGKAGLARGRDLKTAGKGDCRRLAVVVDVDARSAAKRGRGAETPGRQKVTSLAAVAPATEMPPAAGPFEEMPPKWLKLPPIRLVIDTAVPEVLVTELVALKLTAASPPEAESAFAPVMSTLLPVTVPLAPVSDRPVPLNW